MCICWYSFRIKDYARDISTIEVQISDIFSPVNGSVHQYNLIVIESNFFLTDSYLEGTLEENLTSWARVSLEP